MKAIWRVNAAWFETKKEAVAFVAGLGLSEDKITRVPIGCYVNPRQLVEFLRQNFNNGILII